MPNKTLPICQIRAISGFSVCLDESMEGGGVPRWNQHPATDIVVPLAVCLMASKIRRLSDEWEWNSATPRKNSSLLAMNVVYNVW